MAVQLKDISGPCMSWIPQCLWEEGVTESCSKYCGGHIAELKPCTFAGLFRLWWLVQSLSPPRSSNRFSAQLSRHLWWYIDGKRFSVFITVTLVECRSQQLLVKAFSANGILHFNSS